MSVQIAMAVGGAILGKIGMDKKRSEMRKQRAREQRHALTAQTSLINSVSGIRQEYRERAGMARNQFDLGQSSSILGYQQQRNEMDNIVGSTNMSYSGGAESQSSMLSQSFSNEMQQNRAGADRSFYNLNQQYTDELKDVQVGLLNLERNAANRGYSIPSMGAQFQSGGNVGGVV